MHSEAVLHDNHPHKTSWLKNCWGGLSPWEFLLAELKPSPMRRIGALRGFLGLMLLALLYVTLRPYPLVAISGSIVLAFAVKRLDNVSLALALFKLLVLTIIASGVLAELTLAMWADQPWFLIPWAAVMITLLLFYVQVTGASVIPVALFVASVLYHPSSATQNQYTALWTIVIVGLGCGAVFLPHRILWPENPVDILHDTLREHFRKIEAVLNRFGQKAGTAGDAEAAALVDGPIPGALSGQLAVLSSMGPRDSLLAARQDEYLELIVELDNWFNLATGVERELRKKREPYALDAAARTRIGALAAECSRLGESLGRSDARINSGFSFSGGNSGATSFVCLALHQMEESARRTRATVESLVAPRPEISREEAASWEAEETETMPVWLTRKFWVENAVPLHFGFKYALGAISCLLLIQALDWPEIDTAMMTCLVIAGSSLGADYRKSILRILGACCGGLLAYVFIIVEQPALTTAAGFLLAIAPVYAIGAWIAVGSPRIAYFGTQLAYAFNHVVLSGEGPITDLTKARDRVLGILLGITVMWIIDYLLWPHRAEDRLRKPLMAAVRSLGEFVRQGARPAGPGGSGDHLMRSIDGNLRKTLELLEQARMEPGADFPEAEAERTRVGLIVGDLHRIARILQARRRYRLSAAFIAAPESLKRHQRRFDEALDHRFMQVAGELGAARAALFPADDRVLRDVEQAVRRATDNRMLPPETAIAVSSFVALDRRLWNALAEFQTHIGARPERSQ